VTACFRWVLKEGGEGQENENRNSNAEVGKASLGSRLLWVAK
jgi:hypothetical protein